MFPNHQRVPVIGATEGERATPKRHRPRRRADTAPLRCQLWDGRNHIDTVPVVFDDMGHPSDVHYRPTSAIRVTKLAFVWNAKVFVFSLREPEIIKAGQIFHLALHHLKLLDKFGIDALAAGRN